MSRKHSLIFIILTVIFAVFTATVYVTYAAVNPFEKIVMSKDTELFDYTDNQGNNNQPVQYVEGFGIGYSWINDCVVLRDIDFGEDGTNAVTVYATNGDADTLQLSVHIDSMDNAPVGIINVTETGGFSKEYQQEFTASLDEPVKGVHTVYLKWVNKTGCLVAVEFKETEYFEITSETTLETTESVSREIKNEVPPTSDSNNIINILICSLSLIGLIVALILPYSKNRRIK